MKKLLIAASSVVLASCGTSYSGQSRLITTSSSYVAESALGTTVTIADVSVDGNKISYAYIPTRTVSAGGYDNIIKTAVREALLSAGKQYDVLMAKETQVKYNADGDVESVIVSGYPGRYVNWRSSGSIAGKEDSSEAKPGLMGLNPFPKKK